jgi:UDP-N-acetylglucosamine 2-epimerase (non-hydrolysing)
MTMEPMKVVCIFGTRPEIIKLAPVVRAHSATGDPVILVHTGQHYDRMLSGVFLRDLSFPEPDYNLGVGSGTRSFQIAEIMRGIETILTKEKPDIVLVQGDTNTVPAAAMIARQLLIPVGHVEAGLRSGNEHSPEEVNRKLAAQLSFLHFAPTAMNREFLVREGVPPDRIYVTGNTVIDVVNGWLPSLSPDTLCTRLGINREQPLITVTIHRSITVDDPVRLAGIFHALAALEEYVVVFPMHPRTRKTAEQSGLIRILDRPHIRVTDPLGYGDFLSLLSASTVLVTDSGGVQEEAAAMGIPVVVAREETARWESVIAGIAVLSGVGTVPILDAVRSVCTDGGMKTRLAGTRGLYGDGRAGARIAGIVREWHAKGQLRYPPPVTGVPRLVSELSRREKS